MDLGITLDSKCQIYTNWISFHNYGGSGGRIQDESHISLGGEIHIIPVSYDELREGETIEHSTTQSRTSKTVFPGPNLVLN